MQPIAVKERTIKTFKTTNPDFMAEDIALRPDSVEVVEFGVEEKRIYKRQMIFYKGFRYVEALETSQYISQITFDGYLKDPKRNYWNHYIPKIDTADLEPIPEAAKTHIDNLLESATYIYENERHKELSEKPDLPYIDSYESLLDECFQGTPNPFHKFDLLRMIEISDVEEVLELKGKYKTILEEKYSKTVKN